MQKKDNSRQIKVGAVLSYLQMALNIIIGMTYTPIMIRKLGQSEYGLYNIAASTISMLSILNFGFGSGYLKFYAKYKVREDKDSIYRLNGLFLLIFSLIGVVAFVIGTLLSFNLEIVYGNGLTNEEYEIAKILMMLLTVNLALSFPMSVFNTIISANEQFVFQKIINMGKTIISPLLILILLFVGLKSIALVCVNVFLAFIVDVLNIIYVTQKLKNKFYFKKIEKSILKEMFVYTSFVVINTIVGQINWNLDKVLLGRYCGTGTVAIYAVASTIHVYYENFSTCVSNVFRTRVHVIVNATNDNEAEQRKRLTHLFSKVGRIQFMILGLVLSGFVFWGRQFITGFWAGVEYEESYYIAVMLIFAVTIVLIQNIGIDIQRALDKHKFRSVAYLFMSVVNLILTVFLCQRYGAIGAAVGTVVAVVTIDGVCMNIFYHKKCNINIFDFWREILRVSLGLVPPIICGIVLTHVFSLSHNVQYLACILLYSLIYVISVWNISMNTEERMAIKKILAFQKAK